MFYSVGTIEDFIFVVQNCMTAEFGERHNEAQWTSGRFGALPGEGCKYISSADEKVEKGKITLSLDVLDVGTELFPAPLSLNTVSDITR